MTEGISPAFLLFKNTFLPSSSRRPIGRSPGRKGGMLREAGAWWQVVGQSPALSQLGWYCLPSSSFLATVYTFICRSLPECRHWDTGRGELPFSSSLYEKQGGTFSVPSSTVCFSQKEQQYSRTEKCENVTC